MGLVKSALYKHYRDKQDIFDQILHRMETLDRDHAAQGQLPTEGSDQIPDAYRTASPKNIRSFTLAMFRHWTEDPFASASRRMLTRKQYRDPRMADCRILAAPEEGTLSPERLEAWQKLRQENQYMLDSKSYLAAKEEKFNTDFQLK